MTHHQAEGAAVSTLPGVSYSTIYGDPAHKSFSILNQLDGLTRPPRGGTNVTAAWTAMLNATSAELSPLPLDDTATVFWQTLEELMASSMLFSIIQRHANTITRPLAEQGLRALRHSTEFERPVGHPSLLHLKYQVRIGETLQQPYLWDLRLGIFLRHRDAEVDFAIKITVADLATSGRGYMKVYQVPSIIFSLTEGPPVPQILAYILDEFPQIAEFSRISEDLLAHTTP